MGQNAQTAGGAAAAIGNRVRAVRSTHGWTLDELAGRAGVSRRLLIQIEQGSANPSLGTLLRLGDALGIGLPALVDLAPPRPDVRVVRGSDAPVLWRGPAGGEGRLVAGLRAPEVVELWDWTLAPDERHTAEAHAAGTRELLVVLTGGLAVEVGPSRIELAPGDAVVFPGDQPHLYANLVTVPTRFVLTVYEPDVGAAGTRIVSRI